ncbi:MAG: aconitase family protein, partial [Candidatus Thermoplasmatota archaeon]
LLGYAGEIYGEYVENLSLDSRITIASMATEMGGIIILFPPNQKVINFYKKQNIDIEPVYADEDAEYEKTLTVDIDGLEPRVSQPGHPEDVTKVNALEDIKVDSGFIGSCTNGRFEDMKQAAEILKNNKVAPGRVLKIVPSTDRIWKKCLDEGIIEVFKKAGCLVGNAGCAGCAAGQIGQTGRHEVEISTGNRNYEGKQGKGNVYLSSPATVAASLVSGFITTSENIPSKPEKVKTPEEKEFTGEKTEKKKDTPTEVEGRAWVIKKDNIDTDMIYHNRYLSITDIDEMGRHTFDNLKGYEDFAEKAKPGDIVVAGENFGCGSSRQQAVDCFKSLGINVIVAESFGSIYERNAINNAMPIMMAEDITEKIDEGDILKINFETGKIYDKTKDETFQVKPFSKPQLEIYQRGGLLNKK